MVKVLVSACLLGERVRYDGKAKPVQGDVLRAWQREGRVVLVCPEVAGGLGVPRPAAEIQQGAGADVIDGNARVLTSSGHDVTGNFLQGAEHALALAQAHGIRVAILKARSPSCGAGRIHDGTFSKTERDGDGVAAAMLRRNGVAVFTDEELDVAVAHVQALER